MSSTVKLAPEAGGESLARQWLEEAQETGVTDTFTRRHRDPRTSWHVHLEVHVLSEGRCTATHYATSCDIAAGGIGFRCREPIPLYTPIRICRAGEMTGLSAVTVDCTPGLTGYTIGARFEFDQPAAAVMRMTKAG